MLESMPVNNTNLIQGTLDMLILKTLSLQPLHRVWYCAERRTALG